MTNFFLESENLTPKNIVSELDKYIVGQNEAKKSVAISLRNRYRRKQVSEELRNEIIPKNILMAGPTGVGKTEISRRIAKLTNSPFIKVEATKFTEVGYVGKDVDSIIRDLTEVAVKIIRQQEDAKNQEKARKEAVERIVKTLVGKTASEETVKKFKDKIENKELDKQEIEINIKDNAPKVGTGLDIPGAHISMVNIGEMLNKITGIEKVTKKKMTIEKAVEILTKEESDKLADEEQIIKDAIYAVENEGIVFIDEIDKVCVRSSVRSVEVSREGVQRDLLPVLEGTAINTKYGLVKTDHILFIASGAFHKSKPSDLLPEIQGRFPIRVKLNPLSLEDMVRILKEPKASLIKQYSALMAVEGINLKFSDSGIKEIANLAHKFNSEIENIGARRLHTLMEKILEEISFEAKDLAKKNVLIDKKYVQDHTKELKLKNDLSKFIL